ncbi:MAG TPA: DUF6603 domain-containing protein [Steroidobacteraceae bacterium]|nr:DUF6603 domain-containing protein [Steroidobacteraceae bacterium]
MSANSLLQSLLGELADLHASAQEVLADDDMRKSIIRDLGGDAASTARFPPSTLDSVVAYREASEPGLEALLAAIQDIRSFHEALSSFAESLNLGTNAVVEESYALILDVLGWNLIRQRYPFLYFVMQIFSFAEDITSPFADPALKEWRPSDYKRLPLPTTINRLISGGFELKGYLGSGTDGPTRARRLTDAIFFSSLIGLKATGFLSKVPGDNIIYGLDILPEAAPSDPPTPAADETQERMFTINFVDTNQEAIDAGTESDSRQNNLVASLALVPESQGGPGLFLSLGGGVERSWQLSDHWYLTGELQSSGAVSVLLASPPQFQLPTSTGDFRCVFAFEGRVDPADNSKPFNLEIATNTGITADLVRIEGALTPEEAQFRFQMLGASATLSPNSFDNFIAKILPKDGLRVDFDAGVGFGVKRGKFYEGTIRSAGTGSTPKPTTAPQPGQPPPLPPLPPETGPGFGLTIPIGKSLGPLTIHNLQLRFGSEEVDGKSTYLIQAASSISAKIGPVMARVDRAGLKFGVRIPDREKGETGNLKFADIDVGAVLPNGVSLAIDAKGVVTGGGFLYHDKVQEVYAGVMQLSIKERITVKAFGLIATKMPDGSKGFSLIVFITAEDFQPIPVGMGASLLGIGGMIAINRTFDEEAMRAGLRNRTLSTLLFPKDPIRNAPEIIRNLITTFPAEEGCYLIGVLLKLGWFSPTLVYLDIAIMIELGKRLRLIVLGMISALLPTKQNDLVRLNMDALGLIDMGALSVAVDAVLVDSRLAQKFVLTGEMALRASMAPGRRNFVMAVGGFNPRFAPPDNFPTLKRITIALASGNNPRLTCEAYFAITSNTVQFGARAELYAAAFGFSIEGDVGFDVLIHLLPFHLIADFKASVQLKRGSRSLFKLSVSGTLEGPRPLRISGKASFEIFWCDFTIRFDKTLISGDKPPLPPAVDVFGELRRVLTAPDAWSTQIAQNRQHGVSLRKIAAGTTLVLDPLGNLVVKQTIVPLNTSRDLDTFGGAPIAGTRRFKLQASIEGVTQDVNIVQDAFAPGQFFDMTDDEKLASPSFEDMDAGAIFGSDAIVIDEGASLFAELEYETIIIDEEGAATNEVEDRYPLVPFRLFEQVRFSAVGIAPIRNIGAARFRNTGVAAAVTMRTGQFVIASVTDGIVPPTAKPATFAETQATLTRLNRGMAGEALWQILPTHETAG